MQKTDAETIAFSFYLVSNSKFGFNMMKKKNKQLYLQVSDILTTENGDRNEKTCRMMSSGSVSHIDSPVSFSNSMLSLCITTSTKEIKFITAVYFL